MGPVYVCKYDLYVCMCVHVGVRESVCVDESVYGIMH